MKAVVLVGGFGTRLRPLTLTRPKQMLPVAGHTMLEWAVARLGAHGVDEVVLSLGYQPDAFMEAFPDGTCAGVKLTYAVEPEPLDTGGAIAFAARDAGVDGERFLAVNGDVLTDIDLGALWNRHEESGATATLALTPVEDPSRYGVVPLDGDGRVIEFVEKPDPGTAPTNWINAGMYVMEPAAIAGIGEGQRASVERDTFPALASAGALAGYRDHAYWLDAGTPESFVRANTDLLDGTRSDPPLDPVLTSPEADVSADARFDGSIAGRGVTVGAGASIRHSILFPGAAVGEGATVADSVLGEGARVGSGVTLERCVVGDGEEIAAGSTHLDQRIPQPEA